MKRLFVILFVSLLIGVGGPVEAVSLQSLFDGAVIVADDKLFFGWTLINLVATDSALDPNLSLIDVIPLEDQPRNPGLRFEANGQLVVTGLNFLDLHFSFLVAALDPIHLIKDNSLEIVGFAFGGDGGVITIIEEVFDADGDLLAEKLVLADQRLGIFDLFDSAAFAPQALILVEKNILLAGDFPGDLVSLDVFEQRFSQVPAPSTFLLLASAVAILFRRSGDRLGDRRAQRRAVILKLHLNTLRSRGRITEPLIPKKSSETCCDVSDCGVPVEDHESGDCETAPAGCLIRL